MKRLTCRALVMVLALGSAGAVGSAWVFGSAWASGTASATPPGGPVPAHTTATSVTFISTRTAFVLGTAPCASPTCTVILRTRDRGATWQGLPAPTEAISAPMGGGLWGLRFADAQRGYAFGAGIWQTSDGGASWLRTSAPGAMVLALEVVNDRELVAVTTCRSGCHSKLSLYHRPIASGSWRRVATTGANQFDATISVHGKVVWVLAGKTLFVSTNGGSSFRVHAQPCHSASTKLPVSVADAGTHTYLLCVGQGFTGHTLKYVYRTRGTGSTWTQTGRPPSVGDGGQLATDSDGAQVIATSSAISVLDRGSNGRSWRAVRTQDDGGAGWADLGFTTATQGVVIHAPASRDKGSSSQAGQLLLTSDGGRTWHLTPF